MKEQNTIKVASDWFSGEASGTMGIMAFVLIVGMICLTIAIRKKGPD